ncbi:bifunctional phosphopantothenoylcysteine decarboxylase/phosphopantothenate--cysteine ligase CoaBC [Nanoarchaeota archaeon]
MKIENVEIDDRQVDLVGGYLSGKRITICLSGGIAAIETPKLARMFRRYGAEVRAIMTNASQKIIGPESMKWATGKGVVTDLGGDVEHIQLEDMVVVHPATLNTINKFSQGIADNPATTCLASNFGRNVPIVFVPAMHYSLFMNPIFQENVKNLKEKYGNVHFVDPRVGEGKAKIAKLEDVVAACTRELADGPLVGKNILITAGPTKSYIDRVRSVTNRSSGKLGMKIAKDLYLRGANVKVVYGPGKVKMPSYLDVVDVNSPQEMLDATISSLKEKDYDCGIFTAAVLDFVPDNYVDGKTKSGGEMNVKLVPSPKIIKEVDKVVSNSGKKLFKVGFKLQTKVSDEELFEIAYNSLLDNGCGLVIANNIDKINDKKHPAFMITPEKGSIELNSKDGIVQGLADELGRRLNGTWYRTFTIFDSVWNREYLGKLQEMSEEMLGPVGKRLDEMEIIPKYGPGTFGNMSMRVWDGYDFMITARCIDKSKLDSDDFVYVHRVDFKNKCKIVSGMKKPSSEAVMHQMIYNRFKGVNCIIHAHDEEVVKKAEELDVKVTKKDYPCGTLESGLEVVRALDLGRKYIVMKNHGVIAVGKDSNEALGLIEEYYNKARGL